MANPNNMDLTEDRVFFLGWGLVYRVVCAPASWSPEKVSAIVTEMDPPGTSVNRWVISEPDKRNDDFNGVNTLPCPDCADRKHWLMNC